MLNKLQRPKIRLSRKANTDSADSSAEMASSNVSTPRPANRDASRSPTKVKSRPDWDSSSRPVTRNKSPNKGSRPGTTSDMPPDSPKKSISPSKKAKSRPQTKDSMRSKSSRIGTAASKTSNASDETNEDGSIDAKPPTPPPNLGRKKSMAPTAPAPPVVKTRKLTAKESDEEAKVCALMEDKIAILKKELIDKKVIFEKLAAELFRMLGLFERLKKMGESGRNQEIVEAETQASTGLTHAQRKELLEKGPFNLVFHGLKPDWIEEEMDDDPEFKRDVLEQKIRTLIRDQCGLMRDVGIIDVYRHMEGAPLRGAYPVVVQFKARREKEQIMWRAKEKLRDTDIVVTEDSQTRLVELMKEEVEKMKKKEAQQRLSPAKKAKAEQPPESPSKKSLSSPVKKSTSISALNFGYSSSKPSYLGSPTKTTTKGRNIKKSQSYNDSRPLKSTLFDSDDEFFDEQDRFDDDFEDIDDMLSDFPKVDVPKSPAKVVIESMPDSPQKSLFSDFMF